jgi:hypothetical protein
MKMLLVAARDTFAHVLGYHLTPLGFTLEHVEDPLRAIDTLADIDPQAVLFSAGDFPRHWKVMLKVAREKWSKEQMIFILATPPDFEMEEAAKAAHLGVNGLVGEDLADKAQLYRLEEMIRRHRPVQDKRNFARVVPAGQDELGFAFTHPRRLALVTGTVREISIQGASFAPWKGSVVEDLPAGIDLPRCSLKVGDRVVGLDCKLARNRADLGLQFLTFDEGGHQALLEWIQSRADRALREAGAAAAN